MMSLGSMPLILGEKLDPSTWVAYAIAAVAVGYVILRAKTGKKDPLKHGAASSSLAQQRSVERQMSNLLVELSEMAGTISAGLDTRFAKVEALMEDAYRRTAELKAMVDAAGAGQD